MSVRNVKLNESLTRWFEHHRAIKGAAVSQYITNEIRALRRLSGYVSEKHNRDEINAIADWLEEVRPVLIAIQDQLENKS